MNIKDLLDGADEMSEEELQELLKNIRQNRRVRQDSSVQKETKQRSNLKRLEALRELEEEGIDLGGF